MFVIGTHEVDDVAHWAASPKRAEFFEPRGMKIHAFVDPGGESNVTAVLIETPDMETLERALQEQAGAESQKHDGVRTDTIAMFVPVGEVSS
jgi:hypothetical protein